MKTCRTQHQHVGSAYDACGLQWAGLENHVQHAGSHLQRIQYSVTSTSMRGQCRDQVEGGSPQNPGRLLRKLQKVLLGLNFENHRAVCGREVCRRF